ncbi:ankyrin repeat domain-containing protein 50-like protein 3 [Elaphomyces granulatus]
MSTRRSLPIEQYQVGVVCAIPDEMSAAIAILDERHKPIIGQDRLDPNNYVPGRVHEHNVVIACLPAGIYGTNAASRVASDMLRTFTGLRFGLMVGIGGGIPNLQKGLDIRLGDVVISQPDQTYGGVVQYDLGKSIGDSHFQRKGFLKPPPTILLTALATLQADHNLDGSQVPAILADMIKRHPILVKNGYGFPGHERDCLYCSECDGANPCKYSCTDGKIEREARTNQNPGFWYGTILEKPIQSVVERLDKQSRLIEEHLQEVKQENKKQDKRYQNNQHRDCHRVFKTSTYEQHKNFNPDRVDGTCEWVLSHPQYLQWFTKAHDDLLWISADPGCGKSVLAKSVVDNELRIPAWEKDGDKLTKEVPELWHTLLAAARDYEAHNVTCVLDALDECRPSDQRWLIDMLARFYTQISPSPPTAPRGRLKFLVTSRPYDDIEIGFKHLPTIRLRGEEENDQIHYEIDLVIQMRVAKLASDLKLDRQIRDQLENKLLNMQDRTYLWLYLAIDDIYETYRDSIRPEETSIATLPSSVGDAYEKILSRVTAKQKGNVKKILQIVVGARRPLTVQEMAVALGIATSTGHKSLDKDIPYSPNGQGVSESGSTGPLLGWKHCLDPREIEKDMTRICVDFLCFEDSRPILQCLAQNCEKSLGLELDTNNHIEILFAYSAEHWPSHLRGASMLTNDSLMASIFRFYDIDSHLYDIWFTIFWTVTMGGSRPQMNPIRLAALLGHEKVLEWMLQSNKYCDINESDSAGRTALIWASEFCHGKTVQMLLDRGADANAQGGGYGNALQAASRSGHEKIVQMLLDQGADVDAQGGLYGNSLQAASHGGHEKIVQMLLDRGADVNAQGGYYGNALQSASLAGHEKIVQMLLDRGADVDAQGGLHGNALQAASRGGHEEIVQMLLDRGAGVNAQGGYYGNALQLASLGGHEKAVQMLLDRVPDVNAQGGCYGNALQSASLGGHDKIVRMLLDRGANVDAQGGLHGNALQAASRGGHEKIVQMLLDPGADVDAQGGFHGNALQAASHGSHEKVGPNIDAEEVSHGNALQIASRDGDEKIVRILLDRGADVNAQGGHYGNALQAASYGGHEKIVQMLLDRGADVDAQGGFHSNALQAASEDGHEKAVKMLLDRGADINAQGRNLGNALQAASAGGHEKVVKMLLDRGADINAQGWFYGSALQAASAGGHEKVVQMLRDKISSH